MKGLVVSTGAALLFVSSALAGPEQIIKQRAKELRDQNNVRQGVPPPTAPPTQPTAAPRPASAPTVHQQSLTRFQTTLAAIKPGAPATAEQKLKLSRDLMGAAQEKKPSQATVDKLVGEIATACSEKALPTASRARLAQDLDAVLNPGKYPQAKFPAIFEDIQAIFQANGLSRVSAVNIANTVKAMSAETSH